MFRQYYPETNQKKEAVSTFSLSTAWNSETLVSAQRRQKCGSACVAAMQNMHVHKGLSEFSGKQGATLSAGQATSRAETPLLFSISKSASIAGLNIACDGRCWFSPIRRHFLTVGDLRGVHSWDSGAARWLSKGAVHSSNESPRQVCKVQITSVLWQRNECANRRSRSDSKKTQRAEPAFNSAVWKWYRH